jgi:type IV pilus assembly protein PilY1
VGRHNAVIQEAANLKTFSPTVKLFTVGVGISGTDPDLKVQREVLRRAAEQLNAQGNNTEFTEVGASGDNTSRGAGRAFFATDATELTVALRNVFHQISAGRYSFTAPTVPSVRMTDRNYLYKASFTPASPPATFWEGHLEALTINDDNTYTSHWNADNVLRSTDPGDRRIYTSDNTWTRRNFTTSYITPAMLGVDNTDARNNVVNYVRGVGHDNNAKLGDIFHSKPVVVGPPSRFFFDEGYSTAVGASQSFVDAKATRKRVIFVGTNDGMLHAFLSGTYNTSTGLYDSGTGEELFGYISYNLLNGMEDFLPGDLTTHGYYVDSSPRVADVWIDGYGGTVPDGDKQSSEWRTVLISGLRKGGNGYFALDVTDPPTYGDYSNYPKVLWEFTDPTHVGQTWSEPFIGKVRVQETPTSDVRDRWVAIFGGGTDGGTVGKSLVVLDIATGTALKTFTTAAGIDNVIPASPTAVLDGNGYIKFAYVNDIDGSLYKFDFRTTGIQNNGFSAWIVNKIFQPSAGQPVYHRVEAGTLDESTRYLFFGTGNQESPVSDGGTGKFFAVKDTDSFWPVSPLGEGNLANLTSNLGTGTAAPTQYGWLVNLGSVPSTSVDSNTHNAEKVLSDPVVFYNTVYFTTFTPDASNPCSGGGIARVYGLKMLNATPGLAAITALGETSGTKVPYHVYTGSQGGIPSSPSLSIYPTGQSSIFVGFSTGAIEEIKIESPLNMKTIKSWKEMF